MSDVNLKEKAKRAEKKQAALGPDVDLGCLFVPGRKARRNLPADPAV